MTYQREFERRLEIAVIGVGSHAYRNVLPALHFLPVRLAALCDPNLNLAQAAAEEYGNPRCYSSTAEMYRNEKLDGVLICVGPSRHPELSIEALEAGCHVWMEKPPSVRAADLDPVISACGDHVAVVGFKKAFLPAADKVREVLGDERYQPLRSILAEYPCAMPQDGKGALDERGYTEWLDHGCHPLSLMLSVGGPVSGVTTHKTRWGDSCCVLEFAGGAIGTLHLSHGAGLSQPCERYSFFASDATIVIDNVNRVSVQRGIPFDYGRTTTFAPPGFDCGMVVWEPQYTLGTLENKSAFTQGFYGELNHFCTHALAGTQPTLCSLPFARHLMRVYEAAIMSNGERVSVSEET
jgi:predicted dehydrogenase